MRVFLLLGWAVALAAAPVCAQNVDRTDTTLPAFTARLAWELNPALDAAAFTFVPGADAIAIQMATPQEVVQ